MSAEREKRRTAFRRKFHFLPFCSLLSSSPPFLLGRAVGGREGERKTAPFAWLPLPSPSLGSEGNTVGGSRSRAATHRATDRARGKGRCCPPFSLLFSAWKDGITQAAE